ncbi:hypothetical protein NE626_15325, partial [Intestinimonas massiliensis]|nr:hypothetical protein [Intestinimonas massiliensis (ex Afouda et al. 2020)]
MDIRKTLDTLCSMAGPSGFERAVAEQAVELMRPYVDEAAVDRFGINKYLLVANGLDFMQTVTYILVIASLVQFVE